MRDGRTRKLERVHEDPTLSEYLASRRAALVVLSGDAAGTEYLLEQPVVSVGRGPGVDCAFDDDTMSREHAALEFSGEGFRVRDLGSMNGIWVNGSDVKAADLKHGDRVKIGRHEFQLLIEEGERPPRVHVVTED